MSSIATSDIQKVFRAYRRATDQILSKRWVTSTAPLNRPSELTGTKIRYKDLSLPKGRALTTFEARPLRKASFVSSAIASAGALPVEATRSTNSPPERSQTRTLTKLGRAPDRKSVVEGKRVD